MRKMLTNGVLYLTPFTLLYLSASVHSGFNPELWSMPLRLLVAVGGFLLGAIITKAK